jgi:serine/threonine-protein kinase
MPQDIRKDRPDCPGELDGVCVKMMQKDPKYRYADCIQVAEVLEAWLEKFRKENPNRPVFTVMDVLSNKTKFSRDVDTVNNRTEGTMSGRSGRSSGIVKLSTSDSGVLRAIAKSDASSVDSKIDLVHDSSSPNRSKSKSQAIAHADSPMSKSGSASKSDSPLNKPLSPSQAKPKDKSVAAGAQAPNKQAATAVSPAEPKKPFNPAGSLKSNLPVLISVGVAALVLAGIVIAFLVSRG